jgi:excisionase family DNA binding protein
METETQTLTLEDLAMITIETAPRPKVLLSVDEAAAALSMGRTFVYDMLTRGEIVSIKIGRRRRIPVSALQAFVTRRVLESRQCA